MGRDDDAADSTSGSGLSLEAALELEPACDRFEQAWRRGGRPDLGAGLAALPGPLRAAAVRELVGLDVYYRRRAGEAPAAGDYLARFPDLEPGWLAGVLGDTASGPDVARTTTDNQTVVSPAGPRGE